MKDMVLSPKVAAITAAAVTLAGLVSCGVYYRRVHKYVFIPSPSYLN
jgi:hypothetical protein